MIRDLVKSNDSILHHKIKLCGVNVDRHFIAKTLIENMFHYEGIGLAANQIGASYIIGSIGYYAA